MGGFRVPEQPRDQLILFSQSMEDSIPADHPVRHVLSIFESKAVQPTIEAMESKYDLGNGRPPYHPRFLASLYVYGMLNGIRSSRRLEDACHNRIDVRYLMEGQRPDHSTISEFLIRHASSLHGLLRDSLSIGRRAGLLKLKRVAVDGTKLRARGSVSSIKRKSRVERELEETDRELARLEAEFEENERKEDRVEGFDWGGDRSGSIAAQKKRMQRTRDSLAAALAELEERKKRSSRESRRVQEKVSVTDPEARGMKGKDGAYGLHFNAQAAVDVDSGLITGVDLNDEATDSGQLSGMVDEVERNCSALPVTVLADSGYHSGSELAALEEKGVEGLVADPDAKQEINEEELAQVVARIAAGEILEASEVEELPRGRNGRLHRRFFHFREVDDVYVCPRGATLEYKRTQTQKLKGKKVKRRMYESNDCLDCPLLAICCGGQKPRRVITRDKYDDARDRARQRMASESGRAAYRSRAPSVEGRISMMTRITGSREIRRFGKAKAKVEWMLAAIATNFHVLVSSWDLVKPTI